MISGHRVWTIKMALRVDTFRVVHAHVLVSLAWILPMIVVLGVQFLYKIDVRFDRILSTCMSLLIDSEEAKIATFFSMLVFSIIPFIMTIGSNLAMLCYAIAASKKHSETSYSSALITVFSLCGFYVITSIPNVVRMMLPSLGKEPPMALEIFNGHLYLSTASCNSIIFTVTNRRFRTFILRRFLRICYSKGNDDALIFTNSNARSSSAPSGERRGTTFNGVTANKNHTPSIATPSIAK